MSEIKRATLISFGADKGEDKKQKLVAKTVRIAFSLPESNEGTCPVYNYKEELAVAKKKDKSNNKPVNNGRMPNGLDPFGDDDDDDVRRIAQQMEAKYGMGPPAKKKQKGRKDDYADIGMGYDESDSFIDNTDGYDEIIPQYVTTLHGGFYINSGALEFKTDEEASSDVSSSSSSSSSDEEEDKPEKTSRKRVLETSESEGETETEKGKDGEKVPSSQSERKQQVLPNGMPLPKKKKLLTPEKIRQLKKGSSEDVRKKTVKDLLKEKREVINVASPPESVPVDKGDKGDVAMKENKKPVSMHNVVDTIESVAKGSDNNNSIEEVKLDVVKEIVNKDVPAVTIAPSEIKPILVPSSEGENSRDSSHEQKTEIVQLPENLPEDISELINKLKETAAKNTENKIFTSTVNNMLLRLERKCRCLGKNSKSRIYQHLGPFLKCRKETLIRRAKNLIIQDDMSKLKDLVSGLKSKIDEAMPPLLDNYEKESQKIVQKKFSRESVEVEENKQLRMPKRRFSWTEEIKKQLKEIVTIRRRLYTLEGKSKEDLDIQMNLYLKSDIQILWPEGWMSMAALLKIYNNLGEKKSISSSSKPPSISPKEPTKHPSDPSSIKDVHKTQPPINKNNNVKHSKPQTVSAKDAQPHPLPKGAKEMQKLATNSMLSIIPVTPRAPTPSESPKPVMNDLTINILDNDRIPLPIEISKNSGISISPTIIPSVVVKATSEESTVIRPIPDTIITPAEVVKPPEKPAKFANPYAQPPDNWNMKPIKPPTDHKIENIIKPSKPENLTKPKTESPSPENLSKPKIVENATKQPKPENLSKPKSESIHKPKPEASSSSSSSKPKPENLIFKPKQENLINLSKPKPENLSKPKHENPSKTKHENLVKPKTEKPEHRRRESDDVIILDESMSEPEPRPPSVEKKPKVNHLIDLTAHPELKRKPGPKSKTKYYDPSLIKPVKSASSLEASKMKQQETLLQENLVDTEHYYSMKKSRPEQKDSRSAIPSSMLPKGHNDGDDIQKVMEDLKVLQKMSAPSRSTSVPGESVTSSPVSVISFNKNYTPKSNPPPSLPVVPKVEPKQEYSLGFQEAFQRQFLNELKSSLSATQNMPTSSKGFNSAHSSSTVSHPEKYYMNANNNYAQQNANNKYKTNFTAQPQGTFNLMDDMLANFISEYAYPKTANHKQKPQK